MKKPSARKPSGKAPPKREPCERGGGEGHAAIPTDARHSCIFSCIFCTSFETSVMLTFINRATNSLTSTAEPRLKLHFLQTGSTERGFKYSRWSYTSATLPQSAQGNSCGLLILPLRISRSMAGATIAPRALATRPEHMLLQNFVFKKYRDDGICVSQTAQFLGFCSINWMRARLGRFLAIMLCGPFKRVGRVNFSKRDLASSRGNDEPGLRWARGSFPPSPSGSSTNLYPPNAGAVGVPVFFDVVS